MLDISYIRDIRTGKYAKIPKVMFKMTNGEYHTIMGK